MAEETKREKADDEETHEEGELSEEQLEDAAGGGVEAKLTLGVEIKFGNEEDPLTTDIAAAPETPETAAIDTTLKR